MTDLLLDPQIAAWVVWPVLAITVLVGLGRHYLSIMIKKETTNTKDQIFESQALMRSRMLRANGRYLSKKGFLMRKYYFNDKETGIFKTKRRDAPPVNPMADPQQMGSLMAGNLINMVPMIVVGGIINQLFSGFCALKVPFPLTLRFKGMLQRGIDVSTLSASWVSSASFYVICLFGLRSIFSLILGENNEADSSRAMQQQMASGGGMGAPQDPGKAFDSEWEAMEVTAHHYALSDAETRLLAAELTAAA